MESSSGCLYSWRLRSSQAPVRELSCSTVFSVIYGSMFFITGATGAVICNVIVGMAGGIEIETASDA